ncbi:type III-B CRISPR module-associated protein Cmr3 [Tengunoibacter tsumagoiensis]|uniref:CRISPR-associated protein Cmr3 n=1 Tax=Tengunoibacter tsumagoiensis TaxID=2014871 RepID=A0A402A5Y9_9CHLR|nr:type III-B CRISPR module-associated protein Cmr3 [Tengunoibacter tsumagoiensis]GCE14564.1 CRISPR-associated protein Cmr3 [Tengunoibacter tsumagoiensis]
MPIWIIEPYEPLIFRDGRPFNTQPGTRAHSLSFPFPSTLAGASRSRAGWEGEHFTSNLTLLKQLRIRGPLLVELSKEKRDISQWLLPAPHDALFFKEKIAGERYYRKRALPINVQTEDASDLQELQLQPAGANTPEGYKAVDSAIRYWPWADLKQWLWKPEDIEVEQNKRDTVAPQREQRVHISYDGEAHMARESILFETSGLEFTFSPQSLVIQRLALALFVDDTSSFRLSTDGPDTLGAERRLVYWQSSNDKLHLSKCPQEITEQIRQDKACRVQLLTPAYFERGSIPTYLTEPGEGVTPQLISIVSQTPQIVSGWDMVLRQPKPGRRLIPAGAVFFLKLHGSSKNIRNWVERTWFRSINDRKTEEEQQFVNDGFGLAMLGTWNADSPNQ